MPHNHPLTHPLTSVIGRCGRVIGVIGAIGVIGVIGCSDEPATTGMAGRTELRVVVHSDLAVPEELSEVRVRVGAGAAEDAAHEFTLGSEGEGAVSLPLSLSIVPRDGDASRPVALLVEGQLDGDAIVTRSVRTGFVAGKRLSLPVFLLRDCLGVSCDDDTTCDRGGCVDDRVDPASLDPLASGEDPRPALPAPPTPDARSMVEASDASMPSTDASTGSAPDAALPNDGGAPDGALDAAPDDGADGDLPETQVITCGAEACGCEAGAVCQLECAGADCAIRCDAADCTIDLIGRADADASCTGGADCHIDARGVDKTTLRCTGDARCDVDCRDSKKCSLSCPDARCALDCQGASSCTLDDCPADPVTCTDGRIVCGRACD